MAAAAAAVAPLPQPEGEQEDQDQELRSLTEALFCVLREIAASAGSLSGDSLRLSRKISLLSHLLEEIRDFGIAAPPRLCSSSSSSAVPPPPDVVNSASASSSSGATRRAATPVSCLEDLLMALEAAKKFLLLGHRPRPGDAPSKVRLLRCNHIGEPPTAVDVTEKIIEIQYQFVTWQLEKVLGNVPYEYFGISDEVQEQVDLVRAQLKRAAGNSHVKAFSEVSNMLYQSKTQVRTLKEQRSISSPILHIQNSKQDDCEFESIAGMVAEINGKSNYDAEKITSNLVQQSHIGMTDPIKSVGADESTDIAPHKYEEVKEPDSMEIPEDFKCPISLELMKDPVIVSTGQTYERAFIQRWIDGGNRTCPKTQLKLQNLTLTPNYVLRSLIMQWCETHKFELTNKSFSGCDNSLYESTGDRAAIESLVRIILNGSLDDQKSAVAEIRSLAKRSKDNRILIAEAGAIPALVKLLSANDLKIQEHAVTALLNLSIYDHNKELIVLAGAIAPIIQVLRNGSMEARENAAAAIFSLSLIDENKIAIGSMPGAMDSLIELLYSGSSRGKKDAATALFNLCIYQGNRARAVRAGILSPLLKILQEPSSNGMLDEALTIISVLVSHQEGKVAITKAHMIPLLIDLLRTDQPRTKENAAAILLALCKKDKENLACIGRLGALLPLTELTKSGTDRAKRKATCLLEHLSKLQIL